MRGREREGSGSVRGKKGDVISEDILSECKTTDKKSYSIKLSTWNKIRKEAIENNLDPCMFIEIQSTNLVVMSEDYFKTLLEDSRAYNKMAEDFEGDFAEAKAESSYHKKSSIIHYAANPCMEAKKGSVITKNEKKVTCALCLFRIKKDYS